MGLGGVAAGGAGAALGAKVISDANAKEKERLRNPEWAVCAAPTASLWIENAYAMRCMDNSQFQKIRLNSINERALQVTTRNLEAQRKAIEDAEKALSNSGKLRQEKEAQLTKRVADAEAKLREAGGSPMAMTEKKAQLQSSFDELDKTYQKATGRHLVSSTQIDEVLKPGNPYNLSPDQLDKIQRLNTETVQLNQSIKGGNSGPDVKAANQDLEQAKKDLAAFKANPPPATLSVTQKEAVQKDLVIMKKNLANLEGTKETLESFRQVLSPGEITSTEDLKKTAKVMSELVGNHPQFGLNLAESVKELEISKPNRMASRTPVSMMVEKAVSNLKTGKIARAGVTVVTTGAVNIGIMSGAHAAGLEDMADAFDPVSAATHMNPVLCQGQRDLVENKIFKPTPENNCKPNFKIDANNAGFLNGDKSELEALIKQNPREMCDFIHYNYQKMYGDVQGSCSADGFEVKLRNGVRYKQKDNVVSYYPFTTTQKPMEIETDIFGNETAIRKPVNSVSGSKGNNSSRIELSKMSAADAGGTLDSIYGENKVALAEVKACCSSDGMRPTDAECSRYGINSAPSVGERASKGNR
jgi:hypothetical protein